MLPDGAVIAGGIAAVVAGVGGLFVPAVVGGLPEPAAAADLPEDEPPKPAYVELVARPGLTLRLALASAVAGALVGLGTGLQWWLVVLVPLVPLGVALAFIDWHTRLLPARLVLPATIVVVAAAVVGAAVSGDTDDLVRAGIGLLVARSFYWVLWFVHSAGMGFGDVRLAALLGAALGHLGWGQLVVGTYAGFLLFGIPGLLLAVVRRDRSLLKVAYPYGPFMLLGALLGVVVGDAVWAHLVAA